MKILIIILSFLPLFAFALPPQPTEASHPGSAVYAYKIEQKNLKIDGRDVSVFLPIGATQAPVVVFGHGQATDLSGYILSFEHLAKKGIAVIFPTYDTGFFDQDWRRMGMDFNKLASQVIKSNNSIIDERAVVYAGHSKGAYVALVAAGSANIGLVNPASLVLFAPAGYDSELLKKINPQIPVTLTWSDKDTIIKENAIREIYNGLSTHYKQMITIKSYAGLDADHFLPLSKSFFFGGKNGISAFHYYGTWKWMIGAAWDLQAGGRKDNSYIYGMDADSTGDSGFRHRIERSQQNNFGSQIDPKLKAWMKSNATANVLIHLENKADLSAAEKISDRTTRLRYVYDRLRLQAMASQKPLLAELKKMKKDFKSYYINNSVAVENISAYELNQVSQLRNVQKLSLNSEHALKIVPIDASQERLTPVKPGDIPQSMKAIGADKVWNELSVFGKGIVVAGQDTGYTWQHPAIKKQYRGYGLTINHNYNWHDAIQKPFQSKKTFGEGENCGYNTSEPCDDSGHGTHTMGTMIGDDGADNKIGVAPQAQWIGCRNMDGGNGRPSSYLECFEFFLSPYPVGGNAQVDGKPEYAPHIINNSWGCPASENCAGAEFAEVIKALQAAGIFVVVSAGNDGPGCQTVNAAPAHYSGLVFSVAASDPKNGNIASFSSRGPSAWDAGLGLSIAAPGVMIRSAVPKTPYGMSGPYDYKSGTSMAGPHVAGAIALLWSAKPELIGKIKETTDLLQKTAQAKTSSQTCATFEGSKIPNAVFGYGQLDIYKAIISK